MAKEIFLLLCLLQVSIQTYVPPAPSNVSNLIQVRVYVGPTPNDFRSIGLNEALNRTLIPATNQVHFFLPDWREDFISVQATNIALATAFRTWRNFTYVMIDYLPVLNQRNNFDNPVNLRNLIGEIASSLARFFRRTVPMWITPNNLHIICHGGGCTVLSQTARDYGRAFLWLTGLDPASSFVPPNVTPIILNRRDARFVDNIHTDIFGLGDASSSGTVNFFPNGGIAPQPVCRTNLNVDCSHQTAWRYYAESVRNTSNFPARPCLRLPICTVNLKACPCSLNTNDFIYMGLRVNRNASGDYFLLTNNKPPFGRGAAGIRF